MIKLFDTKIVNKKEPSLGIIPIRDDSTCIWGCIDIDTYPLDHKKIVRKIRELELPLVLCKSNFFFLSFTYR